MCIQLKPLIHDKARALWLAYITSETMAARLEGEAMIRLVALRHLHGDLAPEGSFLAPPSEVNGRGEFRLGTPLYAGRLTRAEVSLTSGELTKHVLIAGTTGSGKANVAFCLIDQLSRRGIPWLVIDWKRAYRHLAKEAGGEHAIRVFTIGRGGEKNLQWNPLRGPPGVDPRTWIYIVATTLELSHVGGQGVADIWVQLLDEAFERRGFFDKGEGEYPNFFDAWNLLETKQFRGRRQLWSDSCRRILRTFTYGPSSSSFNARNPVQIEDLLTGPVVIELDQELPKPLRSFVADLFLRWIHLYRLGQGETSRLRHVLVLEEVHNLVPSGGFERQANDSLETIFREIRSFGQGAVALTQSPSALPRHLVANANTLIVLGLQHEDDIESARKGLYLERRDERVLGDLRTGEGLVKVRSRIGTCHVRFWLHPLLRKGGNAR